MPFSGVCGPEFLKKNHRCYWEKKANTGFWDSKAIKRHKLFCAQEIAVDAPAAAVGRSWLAIRA